MPEPIRTFRYIEDIQTLRDRNGGVMSDLLRAKWPFVRELNGSGKMGFVRGQPPWGERIFDIPWSMADGTTWIDFVLDLTGRVTVDAGGKPVRTNPDVFSNEFNWLMCHEVTIEGLNMAGTEFGRISERANQWPTPVQLPKPHPLYSRIIYERAIVRAKYAPKEYGETIEVCGQALSRPGSSYAFTSAASAPNESDPSKAAVPSEILDEPVAVLFPQAEFSFEARQVLAPDFFALMDLVGRINGNAENAIITYLPEGRDYIMPINYDANNNPVNPTVRPGLDVLKKPVKPLAKFLGREPRTLLFMGASGRRTYMVNGAKCYDLSCKFQYQPREFTKVFRPATGKFEFIKSIGDGRFLYDPWDFSLIEQYWNYFA